MGSAGAVGLFGVSMVRNCFSRWRQSRCSSWESGLVGAAVETLSSSVSARSLSNRLAPGRTSGAGYKIMLSEVRMESVSVIRQR